MAIKMFTAGFSLLASIGTIAQADGLMQQVPSAPIGWAAIASTIALTVMVFFDRRKVANADTNAAILKERDKLINSRDLMITYLESAGEKQRAEIARIQKDLDNCHQMYHDFRESINVQVSKLTADNLSMRRALIENNLPIPSLT